MNKGFISSAFVLVLTGALMIAMSPDVVSLLFVAVMCLIVVLGMVMGLLPCTNFYQNFKAARKSIRRIAGTSSNDSWLVLQQSPDLFLYPQLSRLFKEYMDKANRQHSRGEIISDVDSVINEDTLSLYCWQGACLQIPGTLTGIGLLGTFLGLIMGISNIGFSSVDAALSSVETLLGGIELAFYSSIAGVILSILYNLIYKLTWNTAVREMNLFLMDFHMHIMPSAQEQNLLFQRRSVEAILDKLDRLPKGVAEAASGDSDSRQAVVQKVQEAIRSGEFCFYLQPRCNLLNREIIGSEALIRWNNPELGVLGPSAFMDVIEKNGFIARLDSISGRKSSRPSARGSTAASARCPSASIFPARIFLPSTCLLSLAACWKNTRFRRAIWKLKSANPPILNTGASFWRRRLPCGRRDSV